MNIKKTALFIVLVALMSLTDGSCWAAAENLNQQLINAVMHRRPEEVDRLIALGANVDSVNVNGYPVVIIAVLRDDELLEKLINAGANLDALDGNGSTALIWAATNGNMPAVTQLLRAGADKDAGAATSPLTGQIITAEQIARNHGHNDIADYIREFELLGG